jgi:hypothetical protein
MPVNYPLCFRPKQKIRPYRVIIGIRGTWCEKINLTQNTFYRSKFAGMMMELGFHKSSDILSGYLTMNYRRKILLCVAYPLGLCREHGFQQLFCCWVRHLRRLSSNGRCLQNHYLASCLFLGRCPATGVYVTYGWVNMFTIISTISYRFDLGSD